MRLQAEEDGLVVVLHLIAKVLARNPEDLRLLQFEATELFVRDLVKEHRVCSSPLAAYKALLFPSTLANLVRLAR